MTFRISAVAMLSLVLASSTEPFGEMKSVPVLGFYSGPKLIGGINEYCAIRVQAAFSLCQSLCAQDGVEEFDAGFCGVGANCKCIAREDAPGVQ